MTDVASAERTRPLHALALAVVALALLLGGAAPASAEPSREQREAAARHFQRALTLYTEGDYRASLVEFKRAYQLAPNPRVLFNIGQNHYQLQDYAGALRALERYLAEAGSEADSRRQAQETLETLRARVGRLDLSVNLRGAEVVIDDEVVGVSPLPGPIAVSIGRRRISASLAGRAPLSRVIEVAAGDTVKLRLDFPREQRPASTAAAGGRVAVTEVDLDPGRARRRWAWATWAATGAAGVAAVVCGALALKASSDLKDAKAVLGASREDLNAAASRSSRLGLATDILIAAAAVTGGVALYLTLTIPRRERPERERASLRLLPGGLQLQGSF